MYWGKHRGITNHGHRPLAEPSYTLYRVTVLCKLRTLPEEQRNYEFAAGFLVQTLEQKPVFAREAVLLSPVNRQENQLEYKETGVQ